MQIGDPKVAIKLNPLLFTNFLKFNKISNEQNDRGSILTGTKTSGLILM